MVCELDLNKSVIKQSIVFLYTSSEHPISEMKKTILFRKHRIQCLGVSFNKSGIIMLYTENWKLLGKYIKMI